MSEEARAWGTAVSGRGARMDTCPERHVLLLEAAMRLLVRALLLLFFLKVVMEVVVQVKALLV